MATIDPAYSAMGQLVATARRMPENPNSELRLIEWDIAVLGEMDVHLPGHIHTLVYGSQRVGSVRFGTPSDRGLISYGGSQPSEVLHVTEGLPPELTRLVKTDLVPWLQKQASRPFLTTPARGTYASGHRPVDM
jgi:hypothetical protein